MPLDQLDPQAAREVVKFRRFLRFAAYLEETADERSRMTSEGAPVMSSEQAAWLFGTYGA